MTKMKLLFICAIPFLFIATNCQPNDETLCNCINTSAFKRSNVLSEECIEACKNKFGEDLAGMEQWFAENCSQYENSDTLQAYLKPKQSH